MSLNLPLSHHQRREAMCVHMQVTECSLACHGCAFSAPYHRSYIAVQELLRCSSLSVCEELETKSQSNLPKYPGQCPLPCKVMPDWPAARQNICFRGRETRMLGSPPGQVLEAAVSGCCCLLASLLATRGVCLQLKLPLMGATQLALATGTNTRTAVCEATG